MKKQTHGGKRPGAGRPKLNDSEKKKSKVMRIPVSKVDDVLKIIKTIPVKGKEKTYAKYILQ